MTKINRIGAIAVLASVGVFANAASISLTDGSATVNLDTNNTSGLIRDYLIDGVDNLFGGELYWRIGGGTATGITSTAVGNTVVNQVSANQVHITYTESQFTMRVIYTLLGGVGQGNLAEQVMVTNTSNQALDFRLWQYTDFDLANGTNTVTRNGNASMQQTNANYLMDTTTSSVAQVSQLGAFPTVRNQIVLSDADLLVAAGSGIGETFVGDSTYAFEYVRQIGAGEAVLFGSNRHLAAVPEPGTMLALAAGASLIAARRRRKKS